MNSSIRKHPTEVAGFDGDLKKLAFLVAGLRFDAIGQFFGYLAQALRENANSDEAKNRMVLARMLAITAEQAEHFRWFFELIFKRFESKMTDELRSD